MGGLACQPDKRTKGSLQQKNGILKINPSGHKGRNLFLQLQEKGLFLHVVKIQIDMDVKIEDSWKRHIGAEFEKPYFAALAASVYFFGYFPVSPERAELPL